MANLYHFPTFHSLASRKLPFSTHLPSLNSATGDHHHKCSNTKIIACLKKSPRANRKARSDADLYNDIREFLSAVGLPENHVPTTKELSQHGRQDLANVVRRRGYKFIGKLLATSSMTNIIESQIDTSQTINPEMLSGFEGQNEKLDILSEDVLSNKEGLYGCIETDEELKPNDQSFVAGVSNTLALQEKVAKFIQHGELDTIEDSSFGITNEYANGEILNGSLPTSVQNAEDPGLESSFSSYISSEEQTSLDHENLAEVKRLKFLLHQKELELTQLKEQIEKEKVALSVLQTKAETEISKAQKLISEKETELQSAEETLSGLKEVEIQYSGDGDTVELAGSFNGWNHKINLELQKSTDSTGSRLWRAVLWLYPGVYEIKFVVDGHWTTDPEMELVTRNSLQNNVLRVDR